MIIRKLPSTRQCVSDGDLLMIIRLGPCVRDDAIVSDWLMADVITERLRLRQHAERDQQAVVGLLTDEEVRRYVGGARSEVAARALIRDRGVGRTGAKGLHLDHVLVDDVAWPLVQHAEPPLLDEDWTGGSSGGGSELSDHAPVWFHLNAG